MRKTPKKTLLITLSHLEPDVDVVQVQVLPRALPALEQLGELVDLGPHLRAGLCVLFLLERVGLGVGRAGDAGRAEVAEARGLPRCRGRGGGGGLWGGRGKGGDLCVRVFVFFVFDVSEGESKRGAERERAEERGLKTLAPKTQGRRRLSLVDLDLGEAVLVEEGEFQDSTLFRFERAKLELLPRLATSFPPWNPSSLSSPLLWIPIETRKQRTSTDGDTELTRKGDDDDADDLFEIGTVGKIRAGCARIDGFWTPLIPTEAEILIMPAI